MRWGLITFVLAAALAFAGRLAFTPGLTAAPEDVVCSSLKLERAAFTQIAHAWKGIPSAELKAASPAHAPASQQKPEIAAAGSSTSFPLSFSVPIVDSLRDGTIHPLSATRSRGPPSLI